MSTTGSWRRASAHPRDTPSQNQNIPFDIILKLQAEHYHMDGLVRALVYVVSELSEAPGVSRHPAVTAAEALTDVMAKAQMAHLATLESLEMNRFGKGKPDRCPRQGAA